MSQPLIHVEHVSKKFCRSLKRSLRYGIADLAGELSGRALGGNGVLRPDEFWAVEDASFELRSGECLGLIGRNGAGKTTLLRMLIGLIRPDSGRITTRGKVAALIALGAGFNPILSGRENIYVNASILGLSKRQIDSKLDEIIDFSGLGSFIDAPVQSYSSGMVVRLGFAIATAIEPDVLILDEVLAVGDMEFRAKCFSRINAVRNRGGALVLVTHAMEQVAHHCSRAILLESGRVVAQGQPESVIDAYLAICHTLPVAAAASTDRAQLGALEASSQYNADETRWGDKRAVIVDVDLMQEGKSWPSTLLPGITTRLAMTVRFDADIDHPIYGLTIKSSDGAQMYNTNSTVLLGGHAAAQKRGDVIAVSFDFEPFMDTDSYLFSVGVASETPNGVVPHDRRYDCMRVRVENPLLASGEPDLRTRVGVTSSH